MADLKASDFKVGQTLWLVKIGRGRIPMNGGTEWVVRKVGRKYVTAGPADQAPESSANLQFWPRTMTVVESVYRNPERFYFSQQDFVEAADDDAAWDELQRHLSHGSRPPRVKAATIRAILAQLRGGAQ